MTKIQGIQEFNRFNNMNHVFQSDKLRVVNSKGVVYHPGLNNEVGRKLVVSKYIKLVNLENSINNGTFYFCSPSGWLDPFEMLFFKSRIRIGNVDNVIVHASCFACNDIENEEGFWQIWSKDEKEPIVRVTYNVVNLMNSLHNQAGNRYDFYFGGMEYKNREEIIDIAQQQVDHYELIDDYLNKLCLKRNAYKYENELRLFVKKIYNGDDETEIERTIINGIDYSNQIITEITLPPAEPFGNSHPAKDMMKKYQKSISFPIKMRIQNMLDRGLLNCKITQSALYCPEIKKRTYKR